MKIIKDFLLEFSKIANHLVDYNKDMIKGIKPLGFTNRPGWCKHGIMSSSVVSTKPWVILIRGLANPHVDLDSCIGIARGDSLQNLTLDEKAIVYPHHNWDRYSAEDPTYVSKKKGFYYTGVVGDRKDNKCNLCFSDMDGNTKLIIPHGKNMEMIKELEEHRGKYFSEIGNGYSYIAQIRDSQIVPFLEPQKGTWYDNHVSPGPITDDNTMYFNGATKSGKQWGVGKLSIEDGNVITNRPIIKCDNNICFASDLIGKLLFFHFKDNVPCVAKLT